MRYFCWNKIRFWYSRTHYPAREIEVEREKENSRYRGEDDKEGGGRSGKRDGEGEGRRGRDRSDRVAYGVVAGSRKEQQIQWLYRPSPV